MVSSIVDSGFGFAPISTSLVEKICLPRIPALEHDYWSQQEHYKASHHALLLFPLSGQSFSLPRENRTPRSVYSISPVGRFFIPEITGTRVPPVYFRYRRHFTRHQRGQLNRTQSPAPHTLPPPALQLSHCLTETSLATKHLCCFIRGRVTPPNKKKTPNKNLFFNFMLGTDTSLNFVGNSPLYTIAVLWQWFTKAIV